VGGWSEFQFVERRMPTLEEINAVAPETPVFILHLYCRALLNRAALKACGYTKDTPNPPGGEIVRDKAGNPTGMLVAKPNANILYSTLAKGPKLPPQYQYNSTRHFMRELNRLGVTSVCDAGGGFQNYPEDYEIIQQLHQRGEMTIRIAYNLFTQKPGGELEDFVRWSKVVKPDQGDDMFRCNGAGEMLVFSAADFEDFLEPRPDLPEKLEGELERVVRFLAENRWPFRLHATYEQSINRFLGIFEKINRDVPLEGLHWFFDHCETVSDPISSASKRSEAASPFNIAWLTRANILLIVLEPKRHRERRHCGGCLKWVSRSELALMRHAWRAIILSFPFIGRPPERRSGVLGFTRKITCFRGRKPFASIPRAAPGCREKKGNAAPSPQDNSPI
jgi:predicted amidohydrolase YtcJ